MNNIGMFTCGFLSISVYVTEGDAMMRNRAYLCMYVHLPAMHHTIDTGECEADDSILDSKMRD